MTNVITRSTIQEIDDRILTMFVNFTLYGLAIISRRKEKILNVISMIIAVEGASTNITIIKQLANFLNAYSSL